MQTWGWFHWIALVAAVVTLVVAPFLIGRALRRLKDRDEDDDDIEGERL